MTYTVVWSIQAARARRWLRDLDPDGVAVLIAVINALAADPRPPNVAALGGSGWCYLRSGQFRVMYEIRDEPRVVHIEISAGYHRHATEHAWASLLAVPTPARLVSRSMAHGRRRPVC